MQKNNMPLISIIVPVYNVEKYLKLSIDSIINQTLKDFELILVDDGSTDDSPSICDNYAEADPRIKVFHRANSKQGAARNFGVLNAEADLISFIDSDDCVCPDYLETLYELHKKTNSDIVCCNYVKGKTCSFKRGNKKPLITTTCIDDNSLAKLYKKGNYYWVCWCKLLRKKLIIENPFPEGVYYEDNAIVYRWIINCNQLSIIDKELYFYRINNNGTTKGTNNHIFDYVKALEQQIDYLFKKHFSITAKLVLDEYLKLTTHLYFSKEKRTKQEAQLLKRNVKSFVLEHEDLMTKEEIYGNRIIHPLISQIYRLKRLIKRNFKKY